VPALGAPKGTRVSLPLTVSRVYRNEPTHKRARDVVFAISLRFLTVGRRDAYLSSSTHLPGGHLRHSPPGFHIRHSEDIHTAEAELAIELG
jgi:hypothetical protein